MQVSLTIENAKELQKVFRKAPGIASKEYRRSLERIASHVTSEAQKNAPVGKGRGSPGNMGRKGYGGNLRQSIRYMPYGATGYKVRVGAHYGIYVDQGTKPHVILPKRKPFLAFQVDGKWVFTKRVNHPGTRPTYFFTNAVKDSETYANVEMGKAMDRVIRQM